MITHNINNINTFNVYPGTTGVCVSGGADSALLLYFNLKYAISKIHIFSLANQKKLRNSRLAINVISKCAELTNNFNFEHHIMYANAQTKENLFILPDLYITENKINTICTGITKNPPKTVTDNFLLPTKETLERNPEVVRPTLYNNTLYLPWTNIDKREVCNIYQQYNLLETLFTETRSCEWDHTVPTSDPGDFHCGKCWWCEERLWGFGKL